MTNTPAEVPAHDDLLRREWAYASIGEILVELDRRAATITSLTAEVERLKGDYETAHERGLADGRALCIEQQKLIHKQAAEAERLRAAIERAYQCSAEPRVIEILRAALTQEPRT
jgi:hypothetical protein